MHFNVVRNLSSLELRLWPKALTRSTCADTAAQALSSQHRSSQPRGAQGSQREPGGAQGSPNASPTSRGAEAVWTRISLPAQLCPGSLRRNSYSQKSFLHHSPKFPFSSSHNNEPRSLATMSYYYFFKTSSKNKNP